MIRNLTNQRDALRQSSPTDLEIATLNAQIANETRRDTNESWITLVSAANHKSSLNNFSRLIKKQSGGNLNLSPNQPIKFRNKNLPNQSAINNQQVQRTVHLRTHPSPRYNHPHDHPQDSPSLPTGPDLLSLHPSLSLGAHQKMQKIRRGRFGAATVETFR